MNQTQHSRPHRQKKGKSLPPNAIIGLGKFVWTAMWKTMMSSLAPSDRKGAFVRAPSQFRAVIENSAGHPFPPAAGRYRLYVGSSCPWAHRTLLVRALKGLEDTIAVTIAAADASRGGWALSDDPEGCRSLAELYQLAERGYSGRCTVPVLWDCEQKAIVNNESSEIIEILNAAFNDFADRPDLDLYPEALREDCDRWNERIYDTVNNGVYRCGFAQTQAAYDTACSELFETLEAIELALSKQRYLCGDRLTLADVRLFTTSIRFDVVYHGLFKCNRKRIRDYLHLWGYVRELYQLPGIAETCDFEAFNRDYYGALFPLNPGGIIPIGPALDDLLQPHGRDAMPSMSSFNLRK
ncbi:glutathione S-transferase family protein [Synechococcus sp. PCC 7336]|uniref:glutathione S-transferase family protein n=1 Tax=Synechococcus sp. PCC 7336 TaxID=195250 RepID=UPI00034B9252|nr:glutathione S-transferase family protein [Synechococcus sp. PCC 7336]